jgi:hypothetical protein
MQTPQQQLQCIGAKRLKGGKTHAYCITKTKIMTVAEASRLNARNIVDGRLQMMLKPAKKRTFGSINAYLFKVLQKHSGGRCNARTPCCRASDIEPQRQ